MIKRTKRQVGGILVLVLVMSLIFVVLMVGAASLVGNQQRQLVNQEEIEQSFQLAEAGVRYMMWLVNEAGVAPASLESAPVVRTIQDASGQDVGTFELTVTVAQASGTRTVTVTSVGKDAVRPDLKQTIIAILSSTDNQTYSLLSWNHQL
jgi:Tfp pilus assembly protein PilX